MQHMLFGTTSSITANAVTACRSAGIIKQKLNIMNKDLKQGSGVKSEISPADGKPKLDAGAIKEAVEILSDEMNKSLTPHRCPVCNGKGLVPNGFYMQTSGHWSTSSITPETCRSCGGTGIIWG